jgi:virginiamycin B lyase
MSTREFRSLIVAAVGAVAMLAAGATAGQPRYFDVVAGSGPHDVAATPSPGGPVYYTGQRNGTLGILDPKTGVVLEVKLGARSAPHGVIVGPDGAPWITDSGLNAIVRVDPVTLPAEAARANLNTATFDRRGRIWFTGQSGWYGRLDPATGDMKAWPSPRGYGPYGIATTPAGEVWYASLAGNHIARIDLDTGVATPVDPPTARVWPDSKGRLWVSYWNTGHVGMYDPATRAWREWKLPGERPQTYSVWVDSRDTVWLTEWSSNAIVSFEPATEKFTSYPSNRGRANVRQMLGRSGEAWGAESGTDRLVVVPTSR